MHKLRVLHSLMLSVSILFVWCCPAFSLPETQSRAVRDRWVDLFDTIVTTSENNPPPYANAANPNLTISFVGSNTSHSAVNDGMGVGIDSSSASLSREFLLFSSLIRSAFEDNLSITAVRPIQHPRSRRIWMHNLLCNLDLRSKFSDPTRSNMIRHLRESVVDSKGRGTLASTGTYANGHIAGYERGVRKAAQSLANALTNETGFWVNHVDYGASTCPSAPLRGSETEVNLIS